MLIKMYKWLAMGIAISGILGIYSGFSGFINPLASAIVVLISLLLGAGLTKTEPASGLDNKLLYVLILFVLTLLYISQPAFVFPHGAGDFQNHAKDVRIKAQTKDLGFLEESPKSYYSIAVMAYTLYQNSYQINTLLGILLLSFSIIGVFLVAKEIFGEKIAFLAGFTYAFSLTNLWILEQGFFHQLYGQAFLISSLYFYLKKEKIPLILSNAGILGYPHYFAIYILFVVLETIKNRQLQTLFPPAIAVLIMAPEIVSIIGGRVIYLAGFEAYSKNLLFNTLFLARGGILTPTYLSLVLLPIGLYGFYQMIKSQNKTLINLTVAIIAMVSLIISATLYDYLWRHIIKDLHLLYMAAKMYYLFVVPFSIAIGLGLDKLSNKYNALVVILLAFHLLYFEGYALSVLPQKANFDGSVYQIFEKMNTLEGEFTVGFDTGLIKNMDWTPSFPYKSIVDFPEESYKTGAVAKSEVFRALRFGWVKRTPKGFVNSKGEEIFKYDDLNVDYFITDKEMDYPVLFKEGKIIVYKIS